MSEWTFLTNHARVLISLTRDPVITARELAQHLGITERSVRKINADLEQEGYLKKTRLGRRVKYEINGKLPFRHPTLQDQAIETLLTAVNGDKKEYAMKPR
ncbi:MAG: winged helix-turn-helix transcriptional regulator [Desulfobacterota bacterium]|nr:winged helix-turn-helix transcriptional regulator [Thermodesulfobacteriota bacterium]